MSQQVNYWLQKLGFYESVPAFLADAEPKTSGLTSQPPYYEARRGHAFLEICGNAYAVGSSHMLFPVLHVKNWPLSERFRAYQPCYERYAATFRTLSSQRT